MINPCTKDCPDRYPGCECEKRRAWKWQQAQIKEAKRRQRIVDNYFAASVRKAKDGSRAWRNKK